MYSSEVKKTEILRENFRKAIGVRLREVKEVWEGEVVAIKPEEMEDPSGGFEKILSGVIITLRTVKDSKELKLDPLIFESIKKEGINIGDVIYIDANSGNVKRVGRSDHYSSENDLEADTYVSVPKGDVSKRKEILQDVTLHDLDVANSKP